MMVCFIMVVLDFLLVLRLDPTGLTDTSQLDSPRPVKPLTDTARYEQEVTGSAKTTQ
jgi:hypothetical protein